MKPIIKWLGGKTWLAPAVYKLYKNHFSGHRLVEPFAGGAAVSLYDPSRPIWINDLNAHLIAFYRTVVGGVPEFGLFTQKDNTSDTYYRNRQRFNDLITAGDVGEEAAMLFYYLSRTAFNGLIRYSKKGIFNAPFARYSTVPFLGVEEFDQYGDAMEHWKMTAQDFRDMDIGDLSDNLLFVDPPYYDGFTSYQKGKFSWGDQVAVVDWVKSHNMPAILTNVNHPDILLLYKRADFTLRFAQAPRRILPKVGRTQTPEIIAFYNVSEEAIHAFESHFPE